ncbi:DUF397 domain-containing protein [Streptomyces sp. NBC_00078]|uniref:DUF397 domain-containing protein n=1 Tax=unclassified Streptomyces TaxID=2593676 RepID=UPI002B1D70B8|nr:DUF397 domain-containing protein [Streptomyces sp. NBC_00078]
MAPAPRHHAEHHQPPNASTQVVSKLSDIPLRRHRAVSPPIDNRCQDSPIERGEAERCERDDDRRLLAQVPLPDGTGGECVEVAPALPGLVPVRDSKDPDGPAHHFSADAFTSFVSAVKGGHFRTP